MYKHLWCFTEFLCGQFVDELRYAEKAVQLYNSHSVLMANEIDIVYTSAVQIEVWQQPNKELNAFHVTMMT